MNVNYAGPLGAGALCLSLLFTQGCSGSVEFTNAVGGSTSVASSSGGSASSVPTSPSTSSGAQSSMVGTPSSAGLPTTAGAGETGSAGGRIVQEVASSLTFPVAIAPWRGSLYFADWGTFNHDGSVHILDEHGVEQLRISKLQGPGGLAVNDSGIYYSEAMLWHTSLDTSGTEALGSGFVNDPIALGPNGVYGTGSVAGAAGIVTTGLTGGPVVSLTAGYGGYYSSYGIAVDDSNVYWTTFEDPMSVMSVPLAGGAPVELATSAGPGGALAVRGGYAYWVAAGAVMKVSTRGGAQTQLAVGSKNGSIAGIAVDDTSVYWTTRDSVMKVSLDGGPVEVLAAGQDGPSAIAVDDASVYFANVGVPAGNHGSISKITPK